MLIQLLNKYFHFNLKLILNTALLNWFLIAICVYVIKKTALKRQSIRSDCGRSSCAVPWHSVMKIAPIKKRSSKLGVFPNCAIY